MDNGAAIELGKDLDRKRKFSPGSFHGRGFRHSSYEIAAETDKSADLSFNNTHACFYGIAALRAWRLKTVLRGKLIERRELRLFGNAYRSLALHVGMAANGKNAGPTLADIAAHKQKVTQHLNRKHA